MKHIFKILIVALLVNCVESTATVTESDDSHDDSSSVLYFGDYEGDDRGEMGNGDCGVSSEKVDLLTPDGETVEINIPSFCDPHWQDRGDPQPDEIVDPMFEVENEYNALASE